MTSRGCARDLSRSYVPRALREQITAEARHRCGYCLTLTSSSITGTPMEVHHIIPESLGGPTARENLWLACSSHHRTLRVPLGVGS
jgi:5-methylcytosine-specific restriction endonuclease McrA